MVDSVIVLYKETEREFKNNGYGYMPDALSCIVIEERNGAYELSMDYPVNGIRYEDIQLNRIIYAKPNPYDDHQPFRIVDITRPLNGIINIQAVHIRYDLGGYIIPDLNFPPNVYTDGISSVMNKLNGPSVVPEDCPFIFSTDIESEALMQVFEPVPILSALAGMEGSLIDTYHGELYFDKFNVHLKKSRGSNKPITIEYGKNLTDLNQNNKSTNCYTHIFPYWSSGDAYGVYEIGEDEDFPPKEDAEDHVYYFKDDKFYIFDKSSNEYYEADRDVAIWDLQQPNKVVATIPIKLDMPYFDNDRVLLLDVTDRFEEGEFEYAPTIDQVIAKAREYVNEHDLTHPFVSLDVSFINLRGTTEYEGLEVLEEVRLCDKVNVRFPNYDIASEAKVVKTEYNAITNQYNKITLGNISADLSSSISDNSLEISKIADAISTTQNDMDESMSIINSKLKAKQDAIEKDYKDAIDNATKSITGASGGYLLINRNSNGEPYELLILQDTKDISTAKKIWRFNSGGLGYSSTGYNGTYGLALTPDGNIVAARLDTSEVNALNIKSANIDAGAIKGVVITGSKFIGNAVETFDSYSDVMIINDAVDPALKTHIGSRTMRIVGPNGIMGGIGFINANYPNGDLMFELTKTYSAQHGAYCGVKAGTDNTPNNTHSYLSLDDSTYNNGLHSLLLSTGSTGGLQIKGGVHITGILGGSTVTSINNSDSCAIITDATIKQKLQNVYYDKNNTILLVNNGDGSSSSAHFGNSTWLNGTWYATLNTKFTGNIRVNWLLLTYFVQIG